MGVLRGAALAGSAGGATSNSRPVREASSAPPILKRPVFPGGTRVPSGNSSGQRPSSRRTWPWRTTCSKASRPLARSMGIMRSSARPQPKNGTMCSSFL
ncbi:Uncharacterised protein [Bordetella pertussis]|nr:Uncharacterised protein [Bordetella pertussis]